MKRIFAMLLALALLVVAAGCGSSYKGPEIDVAALAAELAAADLFDDIVSDLPARVAPQYYNYDEADVVECALYQSTLAAAEEVFVAECADHAAAERVMKACEERIDAQKNSYANYVPAEIPKLDGAVLQVSGNYVIFVVSNNASAAQSIVDSYLK